MKRFEESYRAAMDNERAEHPMPEALRTAGAPKEKTRFGWVKYAATAACAVTLLGIAIMAPRVLNGKGSAAKSAEAFALAEEFPAAAGAMADAAGEETFRLSADAAPAEPAMPAMGTEAVAEESEETAYHTAADYEEIYGLLLNGGRDTTDGFGGGDDVPAEAEQAKSATVMTATETAAADTAATDYGYSRTNTQVAGVDEADIVKTDGRYIYYLAGDTLCIAEAKGSETMLLSQTSFTETVVKDAWNYPIDLFLCGDRLIVLTSSTRLVYTDYGAQDSVRALIYDISNPAAPRQAAAPGQTGYYVDARLTGNILYLVTDCTFWGAHDPQNPKTFVPCVMYGAKDETVKAEDILIGRDPSDATYTVISAIDVINPDAEPASAAVLGGTRTLYMNGDYLLLAGERYQNDRGDITEDEQGRHVMVNASRTETNLVLLSAGESALSVCGMATVPGTVNGSYAMDIYDGTVRVVTTVNNWEERIYTDGLDTYEYTDETYAQLTTYDTALNNLGVLSGIAENEYVRSCRFDGDICYFVTFRQTDPLFSVDLTNPAEPKLLGALKITGFSEYLHPYTQGRLFGIGYEADEKTGWRENVKLTMFDTSDSANVTDLVTEQVTDANWSVIGAQPQAILIDASRALIAFPADSGYFVYSYSDANGFTRLIKLECGVDAWGGSMRGLFIGQYFYILSADGITVADMASWGVCATVPFPKG